MEASAPVVAMILGQMHNSNLEKHRYPRRLPSFSTLASQHQRKSPQAGVLQVLHSFPRLRSYRCCFSLDLILRRQELEVLGQLVVFQDRERQALP